MPPAAVSCAYELRTDATTITSVRRTISRSVGTKYVTAKAGTADRTASTANTQTNRRIMLDSLSPGLVIHPTLSFQEPAWWASHFARNAQAAFPDGVPCPCHTGTLHG